MQVSVINAAIILVAMAVIISTNIVEVKKTIWTRLFDKAPYILGTILAITVIILEKEKILNFISNPPDWLRITVIAILAFNILLFLALLIRGKKAERQEADA